jgi:hypothetical protein
MPGFFEVIIGNWPGTQRKSILTQFSHSLRNTEHDWRGLQLLKHIQRRAKEEKRFLNLKCLEIFSGNRELEDIVIKRHQNQEIFRFRFFFPLLRHFQLVDREIQDIFHLLTAIILQLHVNHQFFSHFGILN